MPTRRLTTSALLSVILVGAVRSTLSDHKPVTAIPAAALLQPADFAASLNARSAPRPPILQVGFRKAYAQAHIPGSESTGPASEEEGAKALKQRVASVPKDGAIVIYCGCCPWSKCPNIAAAYDVLQALGFKNVKVIFIADDFGTNWVDRGFPTARGS